MPKAEGRRLWQRAKSTDDLNETKIPKGPRVGLMKAIVINGSPRKNRNTATLLEYALNGCRAGGAAGEMVHLYDYRYQGCISCFRCKELGTKSFGRCAVRDELTPILDRAGEADIVILGSPIYQHCETGMMRAFMERFIYQYSSFPDPDVHSIFPRKIQTAVVYTMNAPEEATAYLYQDTSVAASCCTMRCTFGNCEAFQAFNTYQFNDLPIYMSADSKPALLAAGKAKRREEVFPQDCERAYQLGMRLAVAAQ